MDSAEGFVAQRRRPRYGTIILIVLMHIAAIYGLVRVFAPDVTRVVERTVVSAFTVTITTPEDPPAAEDEQGAAGKAGKQAVPKPNTAPSPRIPQKSPPAPRASSTGTANTSGARDSGDGTGASGTGSGTGSGQGGGGPGTGIASRPSVASGELNEARDFPRPADGRASRFGRSVTVVFTVTSQGRARDCSVASSSVDQATSARVCPLVIEKIRFNPARNYAGEAVEARYGYRVDFRARD